jgi:ceramide glucosyltransferase
VGYLDASLMWLGVALAVSSLGYLFVAVVVVSRWQKRKYPTSWYMPSVTILKPLCGLERELYCNLRSFCVQDYPKFQVIFGVRDANDPAVHLVKRLMAELPDADLELVIDSRLSGSNYKVSNLINMSVAARYDHFVIADSDIGVGPDYLGQLVGPLADRRVGAVTCLYKGRPQRSFWSRLGALFIDEWFLPSVLVAHAFGSRAFCFGATIALRREVLEAVGGFRAFASHLADDYVLGARIRQLGLYTVLSPYVVETTVDEPAFYDLLQHELRWARTIRTVAPMGYAFLFVTYAIPMTLLAILLGWGAPWAVGLPGAALLLRVLLHFTVRGEVSGPGLLKALLLPARDILSFLLWVVSFRSRRVHWRHQELSVQTDGRIE